MAAPPSDVTKYFITEKGQEFLRKYKGYGSSREDHAKQQILILCSMIQTSVEDWIHDFELAFDIVTDKHQETRELFNWAVQNIHQLRDDLIHSGYIKAY